MEFVIVKMVYNEVSDVWMGRRVSDVWMGSRASDVWMGSSVSDVCGWGVG